MKNTKIPIDLSIIIVSYNTKVLLKNCLDSIFQSLGAAPFSYEIIVVDNKSSDESVKLISTYKKVTLLANDTNVGFGKANNQGAQKARGKTLLFLNSDIVVLDQAITKLFVYFKSLAHETIVGGKLFNPDKTPQSSCGPKYSLQNIFIALFLKGDYLQITRYSPDTVTSVDWVMGACIMISKSTFNKLAGFDEGIFMYMEEIDLQFRAQKLGAKIYFYPEAGFIHVGHASSDGRASPIINVFRGFMYFYKKHGNYLENIILRALLVLKSVSAILLFSLLGKKYDRDIYIKALGLIMPN